MFLRNVYKLFLLQYEFSGDDSLKNERSSLWSGNSTSFGPDFVWQSRVFAMSSMRHIVGIEITKGQGKSDATHSVWIAHYDKKNQQSSTHALSSLKISHPTTDREGLERTKEWGQPPAHAAWHMFPGSWQFTI